MTIALDIGVLGLGVMGRNLSYNLAGRGFAVGAWDPWPQAVRDFLPEGPRGGKKVIVFNDVDKFVRALSRPRTVLLMVKAGAPVEAQIGELRRLMAVGDLIIDGGNSHYVDTERRARELDGKGIDYIGLGVSGGAAGALEGPSLMAGGRREAFARVRPLLDRIAAQAGPDSCCGWFGDGGAGHFVKMVHNGIEYADMQLIAEAYMLLRDICHMSPQAMRPVFEQWNRGALQSYLIEISAHILCTADSKTGQPLLDVIIDGADQKGTGRWAVAAALEYGVAVPTIAEAVFARALSMLIQERQLASAVHAAAPRRTARVDLASFIEDLGAALLAAKTCVYAQGFALLRAGAEAHRWPLRLAAAAAVWRGGCIIRATILDDILNAYEAEPNLVNLLLYQKFAQTFAHTLEPWQRIVRTAIDHGLPVPALASALSYYDAYRKHRLGANMIQAQRDFFGAHGFERIDRPGTFRADWNV